MKHEGTQPPYTDDWNAAFTEYRNSDDAAKRAAFEARLLGAWFLVSPAARMCIDGPYYKGPRKKMPDGNLKKMPGDQRYLPVFTSKSELESLFRERVTDGNYTVHTFDEMYEVVIADRELDGVAFNLAGAKLMFPRDEMNRIMDEAVRAGHPYSKKRELTRDTSVANSWPLELQMAFADALARFPGVREAYIQETHVRWRPYERHFMFFIDFDGEEAEVFPSVEEAVKPYMTDKDTFRLSRKSAYALRGMRLTADPAYARADVLGPIEELRREDAEARPQRPFENWDLELAAYRAGDEAARRAFEEKLCRAYYFMAFFETGGNMPGPPLSQDIGYSREHGPLLAAFTDFRELRKHVNLSTSFFEIPFMMLHNSVVDGGDEITGLVVNPEGERLIITRDEMERLGDEFDLPGFAAEQRERDSKPLADETADAADETIDASDERVKNFNAGVDLERGLAAMAEPPASENRLSFYRKLKNAELLLPIDRLTNRPPAMVVHDKRDIGTPGIKYPQMKYLPVFTDEKALQASPARIRAVRIVPYDKLRYMIFKDPDSFSAMAVNIFTTPLFLEMEHLDMIDGLVDEVTVRPHVPSSNVRKADPSDYPEGLVEAIISEMNRFPEVRRVYILEARSGRVPDPYWLFALNSDGDEKRLVPKFMKIVRPFMPIGGVFEVSQADRKNMRLIKALGVEPVYDRGGGDIGR